MESFLLSPLQYVTNTVRRLTARPPGDSDDEELGERADLHPGDVVHASNHKIVSTFGGMTSSSTSSPRTTSPGAGALQLDAVNLQGKYRFRIVKKLGEGRFSSVFLAETLKLNLPTAPTTSAGGTSTNSAAGAPGASDMQNKNNFLAIPREQASKEKQLTHQQELAKQGKTENQLNLSSPRTNNSVELNENHRIPSRVALKVLRTNASKQELDEELDLLLKIRQMSKRGGHYLVHGYGLAHYLQHQCLLLELAFSDLCKLIEKAPGQKLTKETCRYIGSQLEQGLRFLHEECKLAHLDLKPENVVVMPFRAGDEQQKSNSGSGTSASGAQQVQTKSSSTGAAGVSAILPSSLAQSFESYFKQPLLIQQGAVRVKISDLGSSESFATAGAKKVNKKYGAPVTRPYRAPELLRTNRVQNNDQMRVYGYFTDMYALGLVLHECFTGKMTVDLDELACEETAAVDHKHFDLLLGGPIVSGRQTKPGLLHSTVKKDLEAIAVNLSNLVAYDMAGGNSWMKKRITYHSFSSSSKAQQSAPSSVIKWGKAADKIERRKKRDAEMVKLSNHEQGLLDELEGVRKKRKLMQRGFSSSSEEET
ncbi:unnamed protein product [Amoebophrya sp. A120]|nr:unnamed protein product [Amoebophrya sp. A120]|eukprot:GSA120T00021744001.1